MLASMLRMCLNEDTESLSAVEEAAVERLVCSRWPLLTDGDRVNTKSEDGSRACAAYLEALDDTAQAMRLEKASRAYRESFTVNYRALFPDETRNYRVDVLEAAFEQYAVIWVNGDKFEFSTEAMRRAEALQRAWWELGSTLERWQQASVQPRAPGLRPPRSELRNALVALDVAWTSFEHKYIYELIAIEEKARRLLVQAIEQERSVHLTEMQHRHGEALQRLPGYREDQRRLAACVAHLNSVANVSRKGRDDLGVDVFFDAVATLRRCESAEEEGGMSAERLRAARILATDVVDSYEAIRLYLREVEYCLERVDPHLCNNAGLVARLVDWEESWEMGARYMQNSGLLGAVCGLVAEVRAAQRLVPSLTAMCEECDVELFLVLPRIMWLCFLGEPAQYEELLRSLLPHHFSEAPGGPDAGRELERGAKLEALLGRFRAAERELADAAAATDAAKTVAWEVLVQRLVLGAAGGEDAYGRLAPELRRGAREAVEELVRELEPWSIELQRHCPEDWNQCSAVLVQCLTRVGREPQKDVPFTV